MSISEEDVLLFFTNKSSNPISALKPGLFFNRTHTPMQTQFKKPQTIASPLTPISNSSRGEPIALAAPMLYRLAFSHTTPNYSTGSARAENTNHELQDGEKPIEKLTQSLNLGTESPYVVDQAPKCDGTDKIPSETCPKEQVCETERIPLQHSTETLSTETSHLDRLPAPNPQESLTAYLDELEKQVIVDDVIGEINTPNPKCTNPRKPHLLFPTSAMSQKESLVPSSAQNIGNKTTAHSVASTCHTDSICSCCSSENCTNDQSRCSVCDGSSTTSSSRFRATSSDSGFLDHIDTILGSDLRLGGVSYGCQDLSARDSFLPHVFGHEEVKCSCFVSRNSSSGQHSRNSSGDSSVDRKNKIVTLTKDQLAFLLQKVELSRFREIVVEKLADHERLSHSQRRTIACLIQAVVVVNKRLHRETDRWLKIQADIRQLQAEKKVYQRQYRRMSMCMCALLCLYLLNISTVRKRFMSVIQYFGIVETVEKVNRTRRMVSDNWRNIPSLLTNFWRIFIFRSKSKFARTQQDH